MRCEPVCLQVGLLEEGVGSCSKESRGEEEGGVSICEMDGWSLPPLLCSVPLLTNSTPAMQTM